jgi:hypothetical protein
VNIIVIDNNILDVLNLQDDDKLPLNSLHILEECNIPAIRCSQDKYKIDKYGNRLLDLCRSLELFVVNGRVSIDCGIGQPTCNNSNSVIDYAHIKNIIINNNIFTHIPVCALKSPIKQACKSLSSSVFSMSLNISILLYILLSGEQGRVESAFL